MLSWGKPGCLWFALSLIPIIICYFLRMKFRKQPVSSIYIWSRLKMAGRGTIKLQWWSVFLLMFQIFAVLAIVTTLALPRWIVQNLSHPGMAYIIDVSASMNALDQGESRLEKAKAIVGESIKNLPEYTPAVIYLAGAETMPLRAPTEDHDALLNDLQSVTCTYGIFDEEQAAKVLEAWLATEERPWEGCLVTDGGPDLQGKRICAVFKGLLDVMTIGVHGNNLGLSDLRLFPDGNGRFLVQNGHLTQQEMEVRLERADKVLFQSKLQVPPGSSLQNFRFTPLDEPETTTAYTLTLVDNSDIFPWDDRTYYAVNPERKARVLLAGRKNPFLKAAFSHNGVVMEEVSNLTGQSGPIDFGRWDLVVADGIQVPPGINTNLLTFGALPPDSPVRFGAEVKGRLTEVDTAHPLLRFVQWETIQVNTGRTLITDGSIQSLAIVDNKPLIVAWEQEDRHVVACGTTLFSSDLGLSGVFPIFLHNILKWCVPQMGNSLVYTFHADQRRTFAEPDFWRISGQAATTLERAGRYVTISLEHPGVYHWEKDDGVKGVFAINIPPKELDLTPRVLPIEKSTLQIGTFYSEKRHNLTYWSLISLLAALCLEWALWRGGLPLKVVKPR